MNSGYEFLGTVIAAGLLGFGIDRYFDTAPWGMMILLIFGFVGSVMRAQYAINNPPKTEDDTEESKKD